MKNEEPTLTPMIKQYLQYKEKHPDKIMLYRMGDFYETFFEDARIVSRVLGITLTSRNSKDANPVPLAGFPYHALDSYLGKLVKAGLKIVICEQVEDPKLAKGLVKRDIVEIITPGAIIDQELMDSADNNYLATIYSPPKSDQIGFAHIDISTGDFLFTELEEWELSNELQRVHPAEILVADQETANRLKEYQLDFNPAITIFDCWMFDPKEACQILLKHFHTNTLESLGATEKINGATAAGVTLAYLQSLRNDNLNHLTHLQYYSLSKYMLLDEVTRRNLEIFKSMRYGNKHGSLVSVLDETKTSMGARLLHHWLLHPLLDKEEIESRLQIVQLLYDEISYTDDLRMILFQIGDISRLLSKIGSLRINPREIVGLRSYLESLPSLQEQLLRYPNNLFASWVEAIPDFTALVEKLGTAILDQPPLSITEGGIIRKGYHTELDELREISMDGKAWIARLEDDERRKTGISSLKVGYNKVFGYYLEVTTTHKDKVPDYYIRKQTLVNAERYISPTLKEYEAKVLGAEERIKNIEHELFKEIRNSLGQWIAPLQQLVEVLGQLDVLSTFAYVAYRQRYTRPSFTTDGTLQIDSCRHPVIETLLEGDEFIPNDVRLDDAENQIAIITGPNMAGKSTYLRQIGLLALMAQIGSFVPAQYAQLPVFDKIFTRVGASDNLAMGQSTFLVEMIETANILNSASPRSLILLDEIGRGTSTFDGLSLAWSIVEYLHKHSHAKTLFATHYHELTELENVLPSVKNYNIAVREWNDQMIFLRKIEPGGADQSYGIQVARLAGIPEKVIRRAKEILANLEAHELSPQGLTSKIRKQLGQSSPQLDIFEYIVEKNEEKDELFSELKELDLNGMSPLDAWRFLADLQKKLLT